MGRLRLFVIFLLLTGCDSNSSDNSGDGGDLPDGSSDGDADSDSEIDTEVAAWATALDEFFGDAPDMETRVEMFDYVWQLFADNYACFDSYDVDWDVVRENYRPAVEQAESFGRFYQLMREMMDLLHDPHSPLLSSTVCGVSPTLAPPVFRNLNVIPIVGGCVTLDDEGDLMIYRVAAEEKNPLALLPGDVIVGFDGKVWSENLTDIGKWKLPECDEDFAAASISAERQRAASLPSNSHLFSTIEVRRYATGETESFSTDLVYGSSPSYMVCGDQIPVNGVEQPVETWADLDYNGCTNCLSYSIIPDTNIGFISVYAWYGGALTDFQNAVEALWDTDALIIDQRFNLGGVVPFIDYGFPMLFAEDINPLVSFHERDGSDDSYLALSEDYVAWLDAEEATFYDHPIAVLTGPKSGSAGDLCPYLLRHHPRARLFGRETNGAFGELLPVWNPADPYINDFSLKITRAQMLSATGEHLNASAQSPDEDVWFTKADAAAGVDTIFEAAIDWISVQNQK